MTEAQKKKVEKIRQGFLGTGGNNVGDIVEVDTKVLLEYFQGGRAVIFSINPDGSSELL